MANFNAVGATSVALKELISTYPRTAFGEDLHVELYQTGNFKDPMRKGFSIYLYRVAINGSVRNLSLRRKHDGSRYRPSLPLDLYYLITPWAENTERQHCMLGWVMRMMEDIGVLSASHLNDHFVDTFMPTESVDIICEPLALTDYFTIWDRLQTLPLSMTYVIRMIMLDSDVIIKDGTLVQSRGGDMGEVVK